MTRLLCSLNPSIISQHNRDGRMQLFILCRSMREVVGLYLAPLPRFNIWTLSEASGDPARNCGGISFNSPHGFLFVSLTAPIVSSFSYFLLSLPPASQPNPPLIFTFPSFLPPLCSLYLGKLQLSCAMMTAGPSHPVEKIKRMCRGRLISPQVSFFLLLRTQILTSPCFFSLHQFIYPFF